MGSCSLGSVKCMVVNVSIQHRTTFTLLSDNFKAMATMMLGLLLLFLAFCAFQPAFSAATFRPHQVLSTFRERSPSFNRQSIAKCSRMDYFPAASCFCYAVLSKTIVVQDAAQVKQTCEKFFLMSPDEMLGMLQFSCGSYTEEEDKLQATRVVDDTNEIAVKCFSGGPHRRIVLLGCAEQTEFEEDGSIGEAMASAEASPEVSFEHWKFSNTDSAFIQMSESVSRLPSAVTCSFL